MWRPGSIDRLPGVEALATGWPAACGRSWSDAVSPMTTGTYLVPPLPFALQPIVRRTRHSWPPCPDGWTTDRDADGAVLLVSPPIAIDQFRLEIPYARPAAALTVSMGQPTNGPALDIRLAPDRRLFEIVAREPDGITETLVGGPFTYRRTVVAWLQALLREVGRAWLVGLALVAAARLVAFRLPSTVVGARARTRRHPGADRRIRHRAGRPRR